MRATIILRSSCGDLTCRLPDGAVIDVVEDASDNYLARIKSVDVVNLVKMLPELANGGETDILFAGYSTTDDDGNPVEEEPEWEYCRQQLPKEALERVGKA